MNNPDIRIRSLAFQTVVLSRTMLIEYNKEWWELRAWVLAHDRDIQAGELYILHRLDIRNN